jgi:hypothetical protein
VARALLRKRCGFCIRDDTLRIIHGESLASLRRDGNAIASATAGASVKNLMQREASCSGMFSRFVSDVFRNY